MLLLQRTVSRSLVRQRLREEEKGFVVRERGYSEICKKMSFPEEVIPEKAGGTQKDSLFEIRIPKKTSTPEVKKHKG